MTRHSPSGPLRSLVIGKLKANTSCLNLLPNQHMSYPDVCVVGGGPAGLASAIALRLQGHSVYLYEAALPPVDKACGEGLMPDSVRALHELGVSLPAEAQCVFTGIGISDDKSSVGADFLSGVGVGVRRTVLHEALAARATELGVKAFWGVKRVSLAGDSLAVGNSTFKPKLVVAADIEHEDLALAAGASIARSLAGRDDVELLEVGREAQAVGIGHLLLGDDEIDPA